MITILLKSFYAYFLHFLNFQYNIQQKKQKENMEETDIEI